MSDSERSEEADVSDINLSILRLLAGDRSNDEIADFLELPVRTIQERIANLVCTLLARSTSHAVAKAIAKNLIGPGARRTAGL